MAETTRAYLRMKTDYALSGGDDELIRSDLKELGLAARRLANHAFMLGSGLGVGTTFLKFLASFAAMSVCSIFLLFFPFLPSHF